MILANNKKPLGVVLINLGTPDEPTRPAIKRYLAEFLSDPRVVNIPRIIWLPILHLLILTLRPKHLVHKYKLIWGTYDGPIRNISKALARRAQRLLGNDSGTVVKAAMTYGKPSLVKVLSNMRDEGIDNFLFIPLYPQYATSTTAAAHDKICNALALPEDAQLPFVPDYHEQPAYIHALNCSIAPYRRQIDAGTKLIFSFHGIPVAHVKGGDPYPLQCERTAQLVVEELGLKDAQWQLCYQSRFGRAEWLTPYTSEVMAALPANGVKNIVVICPGFSTDCLETIEEIKILNRDIFMNAGGTRFKYIRALNASENHAKMITEIINDQRSPEQQA